MGNFLSGPSPETYQVLRQLVLTSPNYRPDLDTVDQLWRALDAGQLEEAEKISTRLVPTFLLNPRAHLGLAYLHGQKGDERGEQFEFYFCQQVRKFLLDSGDGSRRRPYQVTSVDEVHYVAGALEARVKQVTCEWLGGRLHDVLLTDKGELYFATGPALAAYP
ncbi:MAG: hypothetical protein KF760_06705 [Candidatus Eremiobacteraeota bacterium]|nr:hypothetical protein [Candidatus Eremiobacteraeota bacterium]